VISGRTFAEVRLLPVFEVEFYRVQEPGLIPFDGEMVVGVASNQVARDVALGEKGVSGDVFTLDVDGVKEGDGCLDLVCAFDFFIFYPQSAHFFWV
jgi:hypothetical protein